MSLVATRMQSLRTSYPNGFDKNELRYSQLGAFEFFKKDSANSSGIFSSDVKAKIKQSFGNDVIIPVLDAEEVTIGNVRSCTIADDENTSALVTLTFATYAFGFTMTPSRHFNNDVSYQADFDRKLRKYVDKFGRLLDLQCISTLENAKNQLSTGLSNFYTFSGGALQVDDDEKEDFYNNLETIMRTMDFYGKTNIVTSTSGMPMVNRLKNQGAGNSINEQFQLAGYEWYSSNRIANDGGVKSTLYAVQDGSVAIETRVDPDAMAKRVIGDPNNPVKEWGTTVLPDIGLEVGTFYTQDCADRSNMDASTTGLRRTLQEGYEFSVDVVFATAYNSDIAGRYQPILKAEIAAAV